MRSMIPLLLLATGCASPGLDRADYQARTRRLELGTDKKHFFETFPEAEPRGAKQYPEGPMEVFEVRWNYYSFVPTGNPNRNPWSGTEATPVWFYFYKGRLVQYGEPRDWPAEPDKIVELRQETRARKQRFVMC